LRSASLGGFEVVQGITDFDSPFVVFGGDGVLESAFEAFALR
jgi:hypothetical protein